MSNRKSFFDALQKTFPPGSFPIAEPSQPTQDPIVRRCISDAKQKEDKYTTALRRKRSSVIDALPAAFGSSTYSDRGSDDEFAEIKLRVKRREPAEPIYEPDYNIMSDKVMGLNERNFDNFIRGKEKALIMFYKNFQCPMADFEADFASVAEDSKNEKHGYGAVDCVLNRDLCAREKICCAPALKLYSNGFEVGNVIKAKELTAGQMSMMMIMTPILSKPKVVSEHKGETCLVKKRASVRW